MVLTSIASFNEQRAKWLSHIRAYVKSVSWGTWVAQSVKHLTLDFGSGHDLTVHEFEPHIYADSAKPAWDSLSLPLCPSPAHSFARSLSLSLKINKLFRKKALGGTWVAQPVKCQLLTLAQVMISQFVSLSPESGSTLRLNMDPA